MEAERNGTGEHATPSFLLPQLWFEILATFHIIDTLAPPYNFSIHTN
jgi:hypothetical protein